MKLFEILEAAVSHPCPEPMPRALVSTAGGVSVEPWQLCLKTCTHHSPSCLRVSWSLTLGRQHCWRGRGGGPGDGQGLAPHPTVHCLWPPLTAVGEEGPAPLRTLEALSIVSRFFLVRTSCGPGTGAGLALRASLWTLCTVVKCADWGWEGLGSDHSSAASWLWDPA